MARNISLDEIIISPVTSKEKTKFLKLCARRIDEAVGIWTEQDLNLDYSLPDNENPHRLIIEGSKGYDAEIRPGGLCYIYFIHTNKERKYRINLHRADREGFLFEYRGQRFKINYGKIPNKRK